MEFFAKIFYGAVSLLIVHPVLLIMVILIVGVGITILIRWKDWAGTNIFVLCLLLAGCLCNMLLPFIFTNEITFVDNSKNYTVSESYRCNINYENINLICIDNKNRILDISSSKKKVQPLEVEIIAKNKKSSDIPYYSITYRDFKISKNSDMVVIVSKEKYYQTEKIFNCDVPANLDYYNQKICLD